MKALKMTLAAAALVSAGFPISLTLAEDTDIYAANNGTANNPNVLVIVDNSANWSSAAQHWPGGIKQGQAELNALRTVIGELDSSINVGLMMFTAGSGSAMNGGYVRYKIRTMTAANKAGFQEMVGTSACTNGTNSLNGTPNCLYNNFDSPSEKVGTAKTDYSAAMFEAFKYFGGYTKPAFATTNTAGSPVDASHFGALRYAGNPETNSDAAAYAGTLGGAGGTGGANKTYYSTPLSSDNSCAKNYVIFIGNGYPTQDSPASLLTGVGGDATQIAVPDFTNVTGAEQTLLGTGTYASQAACETAASTTYGTSYDSYTCSVDSAATNSSETALGVSTCGQYASASACEAAAAVSHPGYTSYTCTPNATVCNSTTSLGNSTCGQYSSVAACQAGAATAFPGYSSYNCVESACAATTVTLGTSSCGQYSSAAACQTAAATAYPGYSGYTCTSAGSCTTALAGACYNNVTACQADVPSGYGSVSCTPGASCAGTGTASKVVCGAANDYNACTTAQGLAALGGSFASYTCSKGAKNTGGCSNNTYPWTITGFGASYSRSATGTRYTMQGTTPAGKTYAMSGVGGGTSYNIKGITTTTTTTYKIYGNKQVTTAVPAGTFSGTISNYADEWARFLYTTDVSSATGQQNIRTFTIDVYKDQQDSSQTKLLMSMARSGGGKYFNASDEDSIKAALRKIFAEIQSVNSVFASSSLPVSVNTQGTYLNQVFIGMFRPDGSAKPRWAGNLKQFQFKINSATSELQLADKNNNPAISATTGFISPCSVSMWTTDTGNYWSWEGSSAQGSCTAVTSSFPSSGSSSAYSDYPDGDVVEKGGAAQQLRGVNSITGSLVSTSQRYSACGNGQTPADTACRKLYTCSTASGCSTLTSFDTSNNSLTATGFGVSTDTDKDTLISWIRGKDVDDENVNTVINEVRPSVHGGVVHSQPAIVDYGGSTGVIAFYGADDGVLHAVDGGKTDSEGVELWGFIAPETYDRFKRLRNNDPLIKFPGVTDPTASSKDYFFDGSIATYQKSGTVWIYSTMRRGGRAIYAFDVSTPASPVLKWRKGCFTNGTSDDSNCSTGWSAIGQTWSKPQIGYINGYVDANNNPKPVLVFGGGYDTCEDTNSQTRCTSTPRKGAGIWFVDADTGALLRLYSTNYSVPGDIFLVKNSDGYISYAYGADTGGYVYRVNVGSYDGTTFTGWTSNTAVANITIASLSETNHLRKFMFGPDVARLPGFYAVMIGSGDREHPMVDSYACGNYSSTTGAFVTNEFFMIKDSPDAYPASAITPSDMTNVTANLTATSDDIGVTGWRFTLNACEQVVNKAISLGGLAYFGTNQPTNTDVYSCSTNLGRARSYAVSIQTGGPGCATCSRSTELIGGGLPPSPVAGVVEIDGLKVPFLLGGSKPAEGSASTGGVGCVGDACSSLGGGKVVINPTGPRFRVYWHLMAD